MKPPNFNRLHSFQCAFSGIWYTLTTQRNAQIHLVIASGIIFLGLWLSLSLTEWAVIGLTTGFVITAEIFNTALETAMDHLAPDIHPQVKIVKDAAAGAVLLAAMTAVFVGLCILGPPLWQWWVGW